MYNDDEGHQDAADAGYDFGFPFPISPTLFG